MTITNGLLTSAELGNYLEVAVPSAGTRLTVWEQCITVASRWMERTRTGRQFYASTSSSRYFDNVGDIVHITDAASVTQVATDTADDGTYSTILTATQYQLLPVGGWDDLLGACAYTEIKQLQSGVWPCTVRERPVKVTGLFGWAAVPDDIKYATSILAQDMLRDHESKFGGLTIATDGIVIGNKIPARVMELSEPYVRVTRAPGLQVA